MLPKATAIEAALARRRAAGRTSSRWRPPDGLLLEVFTNEGCGTLVVADSARSRPTSAVEAVGRSGCRGEPAAPTPELLALHRELVAIPLGLGRGGRRSPTGWRRSLARARRRAARASATRSLAASRARARSCSSTPTSTPCRRRRAGRAIRSRRRAVDGRVYGLGANDAKASVAAMTAAFLALASEPLALRRSRSRWSRARRRGARAREACSPSSRAAGQPLAGAVFGEPTGLDLAIAQKGLLVLELVARGDACHAAHAARARRANAARAPGPRPGGARDGRPRRRRIRTLGADHARADRRLRAGTARNVVPARRRAILDVRTTPALAPRGGRRAPARARSRARSRVLSRPPAAARDRRRTRRSSRPPRAARPEARLYGSATLSDLALPADGVPGDQGRTRAAASARTRRTSSCSRARSSTARASTRRWRARSRRAGGAIRRSRAGGRGVTPALGQGRAARRAGPALHRRRGPRARRRASSPYDVRASIAHAEMLARAGAPRAPTTSRRSATGSRRSPTSTRAGVWRIDARGRGRATPRSSAG